MIGMLGCLTLSQRSMRLSSFLLIRFVFFPLCFIYFYHSFLYLMYSIFGLHYSTICFIQSVFYLIYCIIHYILTLFFSSRSLLNLSCIFSILVSRLFICNSLLFSRFWIIFTIIIQNSLSGRLPISSSFVCFGGHLSCSFTFWVFLCLFILFILLCLGQPFRILAVCGVLFIAEVPHCG